MLRQSMHFYYHPDICRTGATTSSVISTPHPPQDGITVTMEDFLWPTAATAGKLKLVLTEADLLLVDTTKVSLAGAPLV